MELHHHGVKGMKWGVRRYQNKDGSLTAAGKKRKVKSFANDYYKQTKKDGHSTNAIKKLSKSDEVSELFNSKELKQARDEVAKHQKARNDFYNNATLLDKYQRILAKETSKNYGLSFDDALRGYKHGDFDQGDTSTFDRYLKDSGKRESFYRSESKAYDQYRNACKKTVDSYLSDYGNTPVKEVVTSVNNRKVIRDTTMSRVFESALEFRLWSD